MRGAAEVNTVLMSHYDSERFPSRIYLYTDGGGDRKNTNYKVQRGLIALFLYHDLDELIAARPAAGHSCRNPVERCHCIAIIMRSEQSPEFERAMAKCDGNADIRKECESNDTFKNDFI